MARHPVTVVERRNLEDYASFHLHAEPPTATVAARPIAVMLQS